MQAVPHVPLARALRVPGVILVLTAFFAYCALESTSILWASTYLVSDRGVGPATAAAFASLFLLGITAGRVLAGFFADRIGDRRLIRGGFVTAGIGGVMLALPLESDVSALVGLVIAGLGSAPIYPAIIHSTPANFGRRNSQAIIGIQVAAAYIGSTLAPPLFGVRSTWAGMWIFPLFIVVLAALGLLMSERLNQLVRPKVQYSGEKRLRAADPSRPVHGSGPAGTGIRSCRKPPFPLQASVWHQTRVVTLLLGGVLASATGFERDFTTLVPLPDLS